MNRPGAETIRWQSPVGPLFITLSAKAVHAIDFKGRATAAAPPKELAPLFGKVTGQLESYLAEKRRSFGLPLDPAPEGTEFQKRVWAALCNVPYGEVLTYTDLAKWAGSPRAARAAGSACGANRIAIVIPCHRAVSKSGLGGFGGGLPLKKRLLRLESQDALH